MLKIKSIVGLIFMLGVSAANAQPYLNGSVGLAEPDGSEFTATGALRVGAGYRLLDFLSLEVAMSDLGRFDGDGDNEVEIETIEFLAVGSYPLSDLHEVFVKAGSNRWETDTSGSLKDFENDKGSDLMYGLGYAYVLEDQGAVKAEINHYEIGDGEVNSLWVTFEARF